MRRLKIAVLISTALMVTGITASAHEFKAGTLMLDHPWARATVPAAKVGGGYLTIVNSGADADRLVSASVGPDVADRTEVHEMAIKDGVMSMRKLDAGLEVPAGGTIKLQPGKEGGGYHLMFIGLKKPLAAGEKIAGKLVFEKAGEIAVEFAVEAKSEQANPHANHGG